MAQVRFKPATPQSRVKHSTTELKIIVILFLDIVMSSIKLVMENDIIDTQTLVTVLSCQPRVTVTSCFVYKVIRDL